MKAAMLEISMVGRDLDMQGMGTSRTGTRKHHSQMGSDNRMRSGRGQLMVSHWTSQEDARDNLV